MRRVIASVTVEIYDPGDDGEDCWSVRVFDDIAGKVRAEVNVFMDSPTCIALQFAKMTLERQVEDELYRDTKGAKDAST